MQFAILACQMCESRLSGLKLLILSLITVFSYVLIKSRKRIEILFYQLCDRFMIRRNYAKCLEF